MTPAYAWYRGRTLRERRLIAVMAALLIVTIVWAGVILPVRDGLASSRERYADAVVRLGEIEARLAQLKRIQRGQPSLPDGPLADLVRMRADEAGLPLTSLDPQGADRVRVAVGSARGGALIAWIAGLESSGVLVEDLTITGNGNGTVSAQMTLGARTA